MIKTQSVQPTHAIPIRKLGLPVGPSKNISVTTSLRSIENMLNIAVVFSIAFLNGKFAVPSALRWKFMQIMYRSNRYFGDIDRLKSTSIL